MSRLLVEYYRDQDAFENLDKTVEIAQDFEEAERMASQVGLKVRYVKVVQPVFGEDDRIILAFGTSVDHRVTQHKFGPVKWLCDCGYGMRSANEIEEHHEKANWPRKT